MSIYGKKSGFLTLIAALFIGLLLFLVMGFVIYVGNVRRASVVVMNSTSARTLADAGLELAIWKLNNVNAYAGESATAFGNGEIDINVTDIDSKNKDVEVIGYVPNKTAPKITKTVKARIAIDSTIVSFSYAVQAGNGGFVMGNNSEIHGNLYSNGTIIGANGSLVTGDAYSAGAGGRIENTTIQGSAHAHELKDCTVEGDAYYQVNDKCIINGADNPGSPDPEPADFPITQEQIDTWKTEAEAGGITSGDVNISGSQTLGPRKIEGKLVLNNDAILTLLGPIWVTGAIDMANNVVIKLDPSYDIDSEVIVAGGKISDGNGSQYLGSGDEDSYLIMVSESIGAAIDIGNNADSAIFFAPNGEIKLSNNVNVVEVTGYKITLGNGVILEYEGGLQNVNFSSGPGASWLLVKGTYTSD